MNILCINIDGAIFKDLHAAAVKYGVKLLPVVFSDAMEPKIKTMQPQYILIDFVKNASQQEGEKIYNWVIEKKLLYPCIALVHFTEDLAAMRKLKSKPQIKYVLERPLQEEQVKTLFENIKQPEEALNPKIKELYAIYDKTILEKMDTLCTLNQKMKQSPSLETLMALRAEVHKIAGSAGSYGYPVASQLADKLQNKLDEYQTKDVKDCNVDTDIKEICFNYQFRKNDPPAPEAPAPKNKPVSGQDIIHALQGKPLAPQMQRPIVPNPQQPLRSPLPQNQSINPNQVTLTNKDVVIVDDDQSVLNYVKEVFNVFGFNVYCFNSGPSGLKFLLNCKDLESCCMVILDLEMPQIDGLGILKQIKNKFGSVRVVFLSSKYSEENLELVKQYGAFDFIKKPFNSNVMKEILKHKK